MSKISVSCPSCAKRYGVPEEYAGKQFMCKDCGANIKIPGGSPPAPKEDAQPKKKPAARRKPARRRPAPPRKRAGAGARDRDEEEAPSRGGARRAAAGAGARRAPGGAQRRGPSRSRRGGRRDMDDDYDDAGYGRSRDSNKALVYGSAIGVLVLTIAAVVYLGFFFEGGGDPRTKKKKKKRTAAASEESFSRPKIVHNPEDDEAGFGDEPEDENVPAPEPEPEKKPEEEPEKKPEKDPAKAEPVKPKKAPLPPLPRANVRKLEHLKDTPEDLRTEIDEAVGVVADPWSGAKGSRKKRALVKMGKAAVPALLSAMVDLDYTDEEQRKAMPMLTEALQEICKNPNSWICRVGMKETEEEEVYYCKYRRAQWYAWYDSSRGKRFMRGN